MEKIPTAEELMQANNGDDYSHWEEIHALLIEFAKLHVKAALEAAAKKIELTDFALEFLQEGASEAINKDSILNAYPESNIQ